MSNIPKVWGHCDAGCKREVVTREEFLNSFSLVKLYANLDGKWYLETGKQYKAKSNTLSSIVIAYKYNKSGAETIHRFAIPTNDKYAKSVVFTLLEASVDTNGLTLVYEIAGTRYTETITGINITLIDENYLYIANADSVYLYNDEHELAISINNEVQNVVNTALNTGV